MKNSDFQFKTLADLQVIDSLIIGPVKLEKKRVSAKYTISKNGSEDSIELIYAYDEEVFNPDDEADINLGSMIIAQVAINYGIFCRKIIFHGLFDAHDKRLIKEAMENTAKEIYIKKFMEKNPFLQNGAESLEFEKLKIYFNAKLEFISFDKSPVNTVWEHWETQKKKVCILSSGGKDSLLSYGLMNELGYETHPLFVNESGRHWFTALNSFRFFKDKIENTGRVWVNSDRVYNFMLRNFPFIKQNFANIRADEYPIRLWTVAVFHFGVLPILKKRNISSLLIGDEFDTTVRSNYEGVSHFDGLYDQSRYFDESMTRYYMKKGWAVNQFSILRSLSELLIETILAKRYPDLQRHQVSCHASHQEGERIYPCGKCEKCRRIVGMLTAIGVDPKNCGYNNEQIEKALESLKTKGIHQEAEGASQLLYMLNESKILNFDEISAQKLKSYPEVLSMRFNNDQSPIELLPVELRKPLYKIFLEYTNGSLRKKGKKWENFDALGNESLNTPYAFEFNRDTNSAITEKNEKSIKQKYLWAELSWPEAEKKLASVDIALLPVGAIEQHGPHLPLDVDAFDAEYLAKKVAEACSLPRPLVLPAIPYGVSYHHDDFPGTISISNEALSKIVYEIGMNIARQGIRKLLIINGHGDNAPTLNFSAQMINRDSGIFVAVDTGETSDVDLDEFSSTPNDVHAGEIETSTTLALRPDLVHMEKASKAVLAFSSRYLNFSSLRGVPWYAQTKKISETGVMGDPTKADAAKGKKMWEIMIAHLVAFVEDLKVMTLDEIHQKKY